jgi:transposase, IS5 family
MNYTQLTLSGFETQFSQHIDPENRWVVLCHRIPWDVVYSHNSVYDKQMRNNETGTSHINGHVVIHSLMIKHMCNLGSPEELPSGFLLKVCI